MPGFGTLALVDGEPVSFVGIPAASSWGVIVLAVGVMAIGGVLLGRRRGLRAH
jgi:hypothetical protein